MITKKFFEKRQYIIGDKPALLSRLIPNNLQVVAWFILVVAATILYIIGFQSYQVGTWQDDVEYAILAESIVHSDKYGMINIPGEKPEQARFPFGFPLILAPIVALFPNNLEALKVPSLIATILNICILFWGWSWFSQRSYWWAIAVAGLYSLSPLSNWYSGLVMSEPIFTLLCLLAVILIEQALVDKLRWWWIPSMSILLTMVVITRTMGVTLIATMLGYIIISNRMKLWREMLLSLAGIVILFSLIIGISPALQLNDIVPSRYVREGNASFVVGIFARLTSTDPSIVPGTRYEEQSEDNEPRVNISLLIEDFIIKGIGWHVREGDFSRAVLPFGGGETEHELAEQLGMPFLPVLLRYITTGLLVLGFGWWVVKDGVSAFNLFSIFFIGFLFIWAWNGPRILYPIQPQLLFALLLGIEAVLSWVGLFISKKDVRIKLRNGVVAATTLVLMLVSIIQALDVEDSRMHTGDFEKRSSWLRRNTNESSVIMTESVLIDYLYGRRKTVPYPDIPISAKDLGEYLVQRGVDYILIAPPITWQPFYTPYYSEKLLQIIPLLENPDLQKMVRLVYSSESDLIRVYQFFEE